MEKKTINIISPCRGSGATFVATTLAFIMGQYQENVTYLEGSHHGAGHSQPFYELSLDKLMWSKGFLDFFELKKVGQKVNNRVNFYQNVNWVTRCSMEFKDVKVFPKDVAGRYVIWDEHDPSEEADLVLCVVDPLPSRVISSAKKIEEYKSEYWNKICWVFNKADSETAREASKFLNIKSDFIIPMEAQENFYKAQNNSVALADPANEKKKLLPHLTPCVKVAFEEITQHILTLY